MKLLQWRAGIIRSLEERNVYTILYFLFVLLFFLSPNLRWHCNLYYALVIPVYLLTLEKKKIELFLGSGIWLIAMLLLVYLLLTILWVEDPGNKGTVYYLRKAVYVFVFFSLTMELIVRKPLFIKHFFYFLAWVGAGTVIISIIRFYCFSGFTLARLEYLADQLRNPVLGGNLYGMIVVMIYFYIFKNSERSRRWIYGVLMIIITASILLTQSRGPVAALLTTFLICGLLTRDKKLLIVLAGVILMGTATLIYVKPVQDLATKRGSSYRLELAQKTIDMASGNLLFGRGLTTKQQITADDGYLLYHPHSAYLGMVLYGGLTALGLFCLLLAAALREGLKHYFLEKDVTFLAMALFGACAILTTQDKIITHPHPLWFYFWLPLALLAGLSALRKKGSR